MRKYFKDKFALSEQGSKDLIKGCIYSALVNISMMLPVGLFILLLDELLKPLLGEKAATPSVIKYVILVLVIFSILYLCNYLQYSSVFITTYNESATRRITLAEKLRQLPISFFSKRDLSDLTNTLLGDCTNLEHAFSHAIPQLIGAMISTILIAIGLSSMNFYMGLSALWVLPIALWIIMSSKRYQKKAKLKHYKLKRECAEGIQECLETIEDIKSYNIQEQYLNNLNEKLDKSEKTQIRSELMMSSCVIGGKAILNLGLATVILVGSTLLIKGKTDLITYLVFLITASRLYDPLAGTLANIAEIFGTEVPIERMKEIENQPVQQGSDEYNLNGYDIEFKNVAFSYDKKDSVLKDVSFVIKQGEVTALVGPSGGGKSTAAKLAARFWDITSGKITMGGVDISTISPEALLKNYAIVFQDVTLFNDTVMENIRLGRREATDEEVLNAAKIAMCDEFVMKMPNGYKTVIGENGSTLSGGERQRISIARALLKDAPIILLDEVTASLDVENETKIQNALSELIKNKTVLVIAHRMRTVENADKIIVLSDGYVAEKGTPKSLFKKNGIYSNMVKLQTESMDWSL
ncbi:ABC transporter ATP-binding protein [Hathewaya limosa]|uniref:ATP-binding cassette subfamily B protein n=1 Tax=Hathewaya limosa TaxID=1536 RepID=A0ABU0JSW6_HATLI|nr:ABC transporter ATP-binding protein [Hathewaya limosa]MDQ0480187.1 ATP-binding cassette subfamily B protein [Hathewaya limosa]